jgi:hypothetical protein
MNTYPISNVWLGNVPNSCISTSFIGFRWTYLPGKRHVDVSESVYTLVFGRRDEYCPRNPRSNIRNACKICLSRRYMAGGLCCVYFINPLGVFAGVRRDRG